MDNTSARNMWGNYLDKHLEDTFVNAPKTIHFYDNEKEANESVNLVLKGIKSANTLALLDLQSRKEALPKIGDFNIITDWNGDAKCIVKTTAVKLKPYFSIDANYAIKEGEGDKSLSYWKTKHWDYYTRNLNKINRTPKESMIVVCQEFEKVFG
ncbi:ASCH domain-containing protein [Cellulophaga sp. HaHaR_3_176]|uniref:ASCH domain-containing protein n=1 Tax=Cellulophaga sp. HaHaR_3_176 TaxID=1942464 RepID=UPI001C1F2EC2|nr:ASCH domain-containing protein [Cellulophaga sp. HaHaR_3_176]QWX83804.1 ASCH domain-containing protein [Cellulophaga sp. HaHaR_3_176]